MKAIALLVLCIFATPVFAQPVDIGQEVVTVQNKVGLINIVVDNLFSEGDKVVKIEYFVGEDVSSGERKIATFAGEDFNDFWSNWNDDAYAFNRVLQIENPDVVVTDEQVGSTFVNVIPEVVEESVL